MNENQPRNERVTFFLSCKVRLHISLIFLRLQRDLISERLSAIFKQYFFFTDPFFVTS